MTKPGQIGFSQRIQLPWMEQTAHLVLEGNNRKEITLHLQELLQNKLSIGGSARWGNRGKTISILLKVWLTGCPKWPFIQKKGLDLLRERPDRYHLPIHWGMTMAVYPFFGAVAEITGRLLRLQETVNTTQILRRIKERYGERETVSRAARRILRVFSDWGVLEDVGTKGTYRLMGEKRSLNDETLNLWLVAARLAVVEGQPESIRILSQHPSLFPFQVDVPSSKMLEAWKVFTITRHGFDDDVLVSLIEIKQ